MTQASEAARLSEVISDLERERTLQASEVARLSAKVTESRRDDLKHEVPRLGSSPQTPIACDAGDAAGLLRIVEAQASDLVRLRRALLAAQTLAGVRLRVILAVYEWLRSVVLGDVALTQDAIGDVIERSRWRRIGQRVGLAKRLAWETGHWQTDLTPTSDDSVSNIDTHTRRPSLAQSLMELDRLHGLLDQLRWSRWRKLGHRLGLAKRLFVGVG
jgi:hypothetical protein